MDLGPPILLCQNVPVILIDTVRSLSEVGVEDKGALFSYLNIQNPQLAASIKIWIEWDPLTMVLL